MTTSARFIAIEGLDGSGGTTQVARLAATLRGAGHTVLCTREPTGGPVGTLIRRALSTTDPASVLSDSVLPYLFAADRRDHLDRVVQPALRDGAVVITDRYVPSSLAYQGLAIGVPAALALNASFPAPELTVVLDVPPEECMRRIRARGDALERFEDTDRLLAIRGCYAEGLRTLEARGDRVLRLDGTAPMDVLAARISAAVSALPGLAAT